MRLFRHRYTILLSALTGILILGCRQEELPSDPSEGSRVAMALGNEKSGRAHFEDKNGTASFVWDTGTDMIAVISKSGSIASWDGGSFHSPMSIYLLDPEAPNKVNRATSTRSLAADASAPGDGFYCLSPVNGSSLCQMSESSAEVAVEFSMPALFEQSASEHLEEFEKYCFIHGESTVLSAPSPSDKNFYAKTTYFRAIPATFRFNIKNNTENSLNMESVKITCDKLFPDKLRWSTDGSTPVIGETSDKSGYFNTIKTSINNGLGEIIPAKAGGVISSGVYYSMCLPFDDASSLEGGTLAFIIESDKKVHTFNISTSEFFKDLPVKKFESNKIYTFNITMNDNSVELENIIISDWIGDPFFLPTEDVTATLKLDATYWVQDRENVYTFGFMRMFDDNNRDVQWAECNIGEYLYYASDVTHYWSQISPSDESDKTYLAPYYDNVRDFFWQTPSRDDFIQLFSLPEENIIMGKDEESQVYGLRFKSVDNPGASIFLPCSGRKEEHTEFPPDGSTVITHTFHGYYWTKEAADPENAWLLHFCYSQVDTVINDVSNFSDFYKVLNSGKDLYEFQTSPIGSGSKLYTTRAIIKNE